MEKGDWPAASRLFAQAAQLRPDRPQLRVQYAHALKEMGQMDEALAQYELASDGDDDGLYHLAALRVQTGDRLGGAKGLNTLLSRNPDHALGYAGLARFGLTDHVPVELRQRLRDYHRDSLAEHLTRMAHLIDQAKGLMVEAPNRYDAVRAALMVEAPAISGAAPVLHIAVDARDCVPAFLRTTLVSLRQSPYQHWIARVVASADVAGHPVASLTDIDPRICFAPGDDGIAAADPPLATIHVSAGTWLDPAALGWIAHVFSTTAATACTSDWDCSVASWDGPDHHFGPQLRGTFDLDWLLATDFPPPLAAFRGSGPDRGAAMDPNDRRQALAQGASAGRLFAHVPLPIASVTRHPARAGQARELDMPAPVWSLELGGYRPAAGPSPVPGIVLSIRSERPPLTCGIARDPAEPVRVIIPTRDGADMLDIMVRSLIACAERPELLRITIIDNRSQDAATGRLLKTYKAERIADVHPYDAPFNWSRLNNLAVEHSQEPLLVFANNDMKMLGQSWDARVRGQLARPDVGVVGARLLYPDGQIQHAGMLMGFAEGAPVHEGVFAAHPDDRENPHFDQVRAVAAVTGAFFATRRDLFDDMGGFDEARFAVAYNDVDFCLSVRAAGRKIIYDPGIELVHYESRTRGLNDNRAKIAWDQGELRALYQKWGRGMLIDPWVSPLRRPSALRGIGAADAATVSDHIAAAMKPLFPSYPRSVRDV